MSLQVREAQFDVILAQGPRCIEWPSVGVRTLSMFCAELGLKVGTIGGPSIHAHGVLPHPGTGGLVIASDTQGRIHRYRARSIVRIDQTVDYPPPFQGWISDGLIPVATARKLLTQSRVLWQPTTVILGTGNEALRFGSELLESDRSRYVYCVETQDHKNFDSKKIQGWEVERRRFETLGGKILWAQLLSLRKKRALLWELKLEDSVGTRILEVARVISAGPYVSIFGVREYPAESLLFLLEQTAPQTRTDNIDGWNLEETRARWIAGKIAKALLIDFKGNQDQLGRNIKKNKNKIELNRAHLEKGLELEWSGKWLATETQKKFKEFAGTPKHSHTSRLVAAIECIEDISCNLCEKACPEDAIKIQRSSEGAARFLIEGDCTACGACLSACPSRVPVLLHEDAQKPLAKLVLASKQRQRPELNEIVEVLNRKGEKMGTARVLSIERPEHDATLAYQIHLEIAPHLIWDVRGYRLVRSEGRLNERQILQPLYNVLEETVEITINGDKRRVRDQLPISLALFEIGMSRPEDNLMCENGACGLCTIWVDGTKKLACQTKIHKGIGLKFMENQESQATEPELCACLHLTEKELERKIKTHRLTSVESLVINTQIAAGTCHGQRCKSNFQRLLVQNSVEGSERWIDWRFPWMDWTINT
jgi:ferredoxin